jgi:hypothetical protein
MHAPWREHEHPANQSTPTIGFARLRKPVHDLLAHPAASAAALEPAKLKDLDAPAWEDDCGKA